jgi:hypothetical protein
MRQSLGNGLCAAAIVLMADYEITDWRAWATIILLAVLVGNSMWHGKPQRAFPSANALAEPQSPNENA